MQNSGVRSFSIELDEQTKQGYTKPRKNNTLGKFGPCIETIVYGIHTVPHMFDYAVEKYRDLPCMGSRQVLKIHHHSVTLDGNRKKVWEIPEFGPLVWDDYKTVGRKVYDFGSGIVQFAGLSSGDKVGIYENTRAEWMIAALGCLRHNNPIVTVYANLGEEALVLAIQETEISTMIVNGSFVPKLKSFANRCPALKYLIHIGPIPEKVDKDDHFRIISFEDVMELGRENPIIPRNPPQPDDLALIMYTSGTQSAAKGVMIAHRNIIASVASGTYCVNFGSGGKETILSYLPLAHIYEFIIEIVTISNGGKIVYGSPRTLTDSGAKPYGDLHAAQPTIITVVPRVLETLKKFIMEKIYEKGLAFYWLFKRAYASKRAQLLAGDEERSWWDVLIFDSLKKLMGDNLRLIICGGAPLSAEAQMFARICFGVPVLQGYGLTETCAITCVQPLEHKIETQCIGRPCVAILTRLRDVPELGYSTLDKPYPRGELGIKGAAVCMGYFNRPKENNEAFDNEGWFWSGDIAQLLPDGTFQIIDRKKNLVKIANGEYVALEHLEMIYGTSPFVSPNGICVYGDGFSMFLVALIVPQETFLKSWAAHHGIRGDYHTLCRDPRVKAAVLNSLKKIALKHNKPKYEYIHDCYLVTDEWTPENGVLTPSFKIQRAKIIAKYKSEIEKMYKTTPKSKL